jgi:hypothetical protein
MFPGEKEAMQIELIYDKCGTPPEETWPGLNELKFFPELGPKKPVSRQIREFLMSKCNAK